MGIKIDGKVFEIVPHPVRYCCIAPVYRGYRDMTQRLRDPVDLGNGVALSLTPSSIMELADGEGLPDEIREAAKAELVLAAEDEDVVSSIDTTDYGKWEELEERITLANLALWIARPSSIGFEWVINCFKEIEGKEPQIEDFFECSRFIPLERYKNEELEPQDFQRAKELNLALASTPRDGTIWTAKWALLEALREYPSVGRYLLIWIGLEALFGSEEAIEITY